MSETDEKVERVVQLARETGMRGILLGLQSSVAWLTGGRTNRIDGSREPGAGALLVTVDGRRVIVANNIESPRLAQEVAPGFEVEEFSWVSERADPSLPFGTAARVAGGAIGSDLPSPLAEAMEPAIAQLRAPLVGEEIERYRRLGADAGRALGEAMVRVPPRCTELKAASVVAEAMARIGTRPLVLLAAADDRIARFRHPVPTDRPWSQRLLVGTCVEREGLIVALSRIISVRDDDELSRRTRAAASAFAAMLAATRPGACGARMFEAAAAAYAAAGFPGEEGRHHQGGAIGYRAREWVAHPASQDACTLPQAFAWNPTVTGTKVEDTCLVDADGRVEMLTPSPGWPTIAMNVGGHDVHAADILVIG